MIRIMDCFLLEGEKFLFRVALTLALLYQKHKKQNISLDRMRTFCESLATVVSPSQLIAQSLKVTRVSRKEISRAKTKADLLNQNITFSESPIHQSAGQSTIRPNNSLSQYSLSSHSFTLLDMISTKDLVLGARIAPRRFRSSVLSDWSDLDVLWEWLPERVIVKEPLVVFCSQENGI